MSQKLIDYIMRTRHYKSGEGFKASDINVLLSGRKYPVKIATIRDALGVMVRCDLLEVLPRTSQDESYVYVRSAPRPIFADGKPLASRPWRPGRVVEDHSPRWC